MTNDQPYQVLARKYRPQTFADLFGHEALVQTLSNAIASHQIAHAFLLTGIRGVGKTTTARILARAFNCVGSDGQGSETINPCGMCEPCVSILQGSHMDVMEMDAASRTGVDDIREIIDSIPYKPTSARYKVYIIDEVHMLSKNAFNALLKTLEEPPEHVKFIMATTEVRKVPVTVLSRCQRFDLKRLSMDALVTLLKTICTKENIAADDEALTLIAKTAEGSARDAVSLLDQARSMSGEVVTVPGLQAMLGLADRGKLYDLLEALVRGEIADALTLFDALLMDGGDPILVFQDILEVIHTLTQAHIQKTPHAYLPEAEAARVRDLASTLRPDVLGRLWQVILKGLQEMRTAPMPEQAAEMVLVRAAHLADIPTPLELLSLKPVAEPYAGSGMGGALPKSPPSLISEPVSIQPVSEGDLDVNTFEDITKLFYVRKEMLLHHQLMKNVCFVNLHEETLTLRLLDNAPKGLGTELSKKLTAWLGKPWQVVIVDEGGGPTLEAQLGDLKTKLKEESQSHPLVQSVLQTFPGAEITNVTPLENQDRAA